MAVGNHSFVAYIDESGDEGFKFPRPGEQGSSHWFIMSAVVFKAENELAQVKWMDKARVALGRDASKPLHFESLKHEHKVAYCKTIANAECRAISVFVYKPEIQARWTFARKGVLYNYVSRFLLERVTWLCRERFRDVTKPPLAGDGRVRIVYSKRRNFSPDDFRLYLETLRNEGDMMMDWNVIDGEAITAVPHEQLRGLQFADAIASGLFAALQIHRVGVTESRYLKESLRMYYHRNGRYFSYGFKPFPSSSVEAVKKLNCPTLRELLGISEFDAQ